MFALRGGIFGVEGAYREKIGANATPKRAISGTRTTSLSGGRDGTRRQLK